MSRKVWGLPFMCAAFSDNVAETADVPASRGDYVAAEGIWWCLTVGVTPATLWHCAVSQKQHNLIYVAPGPRGCCGERVAIPEYAAACVPRGQHYGCMHDAEWPCTARRTRLRLVRLWSGYGSSAMVCISLLCQRTLVGGMYRMQWVASAYQNQWGALIGDTVPVCRYVSAILR